MNLFVFQTEKKYFTPYQIKEYSVSQWAVGLLSRCTHNLYSILLLNTPSSTWYQCQITFPHTIIVKSPYNGISMREGGECPLFHLLWCHWSWENWAVILELLRRNWFITWSELVPQWERKQLVLDASPSMFTFLKIFSIREHWGMPENYSVASVHIGNILFPFALWNQLTSGNKPVCPV